MRAGCYRRGNRFTTRKLSSTIPGSISPTAFPLRGRCLLCVLRVEQFHPGSCRKVLSSRSPHRGMWFTSAMREMIVSCLATTWRSESRSVCSCATSLLRPPISLAASLSACAMAACSRGVEQVAAAVQAQSMTRTRIRRMSRVRRWRGEGGSKMVTQPGAVEALLNSCVAHSHSGAHLRRRGVR